MIDPEFGFHDYDSDSSDGTSAQKREPLAKNFNLATSWFVIEWKFHSCETF